jgi:hypothetical protein
MDSEFCLPHLAEYLKDIPGPATYPEALAEHPRYLTMPTTVSALEHGKYLLERTNVLRRQIHSGELRNCSPAEAFWTIHKIHVGNTMLQNIIAMHEFVPNLQATASGMATTKQPEFTYGTYRITELSMMILGDSAMLGVPLIIMPRIAENVFTKAQEVVDQRDSFSPADKIAVASTLANIIDLTHVKINGMGRSSEDWMLELQFRLFEGDISQIKTWSQSGLRARGLGNFLIGEAKAEYEARNRLMDDRRRARRPFERYLIQSFMEELQTTGVLDQYERPAESQWASKKMVSEILTKMQEQDTGNTFAPIPSATMKPFWLASKYLLDTNPETMGTILNTLIADCTNPEMRKKSKLQGVADVMMSQAPQYAYKHYEFNNDCVDQEALDAYTFYMGQHP